MFSRGGRSKKKIGKKMENTLKTNETDWFLYDGRADQLTRFIRCEHPPLIHSKNKTILKTT